MRQPTKDNIRPSLQVVSPAVLREEVVSLLNRVSRLRTLFL